MVCVRKLLALIVVVVVFLLVLICPSLGGGHTGIVPRVTRILFVTEILLALLAMGMFFFLRKMYCTEPLALYDAGAAADTPVRVYLSNDVSLRAVTSFLSRHANVIGVYIFGAGSVLLNALFIYSDAQCMDFFSGGRVVDEHVRLLTSCVKLLMVLAEIPLLHYMTTITFAHARRLAATAAILVLIGANSALWLFNFMSKSKLINIFPNPIGNTTGADLGAACVNNNTIMGVFTEQMANVFFPFYMEFCIVAIEILYGVYVVRTIRHPIITQFSTRAEDYQSSIQTVLDLANTPNVCLVPTGFHRTDLDDDGENEELDGATYEENERSSLLDAERSSIQRRPTAAAAATTAAAATAAAARQYRQQQQQDADSQGVIIEVLHPANTLIEQDRPVCVRVCSHFLKLFNPLTALIIGLVQATLTLAFLQQIDSIDSGYMSSAYFSQYCAAPLLLFSILLDALPMLFITTYCCVILSRFMVRRRNPLPLRSVILVSLVGISVLCCFKVIVIAISLGQDDAQAPHEVAVATLSLFETLVYWPQYYLQAILIFFAQRRKPDLQHPLYHTLQGCLSYLTMNNLVRWFLWSFLNVDYLRSRVELQTVNGWDDLVLLLSPLFIYFYFVCTFLLLDIKSLLKERAPVRWQLDLAVTSLRPHQR